MNAHGVQAWAPTLSRNAQAYTDPARPSLGTRGRTQCRPYCVRWRVLSCVSERAGVHNSGRTVYGGVVCAAYTVRLVICVHTRVRCVRTQFYGQTVYVRGLCRVHSSRRKLCTPLPLVLPVHSSMGKLCTLVVSRWRTQFEPYCVRWRGSSRTVYVRGVALAYTVSGLLCTPSVRS